MRILKLLGIVAGAVLLLLVAVLVAIGWLIDPNDYKGEITAAVARSTGRELTLAGDLELELFPVLRIAVGEASLSNAEGFAPAAIARIESAELRIALLPLFSRRIEIGAVRLDGLELNLSRNAQGRSNWDDLSASAAAGSAQDGGAAEGSGAAFALNVGAVDVTNARVTWTDAAAGSRCELDDFDLELGALDLSAFPFAARFELTGKSIVFSTQAGAEGQSASDAVELPLDALRSLSASGEVRFQDARLMDLALTDAAVTLRSGDGRVELRPRASLYGGRYSGEIQIEAQQAAARVTLSQELEDVDLLALWRDLLGSETLSGTGTVSADLTATGSSLGALRRDMDGELAFTFTDGALEGVDLWYELRRARAVAAGDPAPAREGPRHTEFSSVSASGAVADAVITTRDLSATLPFMSIVGTGTVNTLTGGLDLDLDARFVDGDTLQSDPELAKLAGEEIPLTVTGTLEAPSVRPDFGELVSERAREEVRERIEQEKEEAKTRLRNRLQEAIEQ